MAILDIRVLRYQRLEEVEIGKKEMWKSIMTAEFELTAAPECGLASSKEESFLPSILHQLLGQPSFLSQQ